MLKSKIQNPIRRVYDAIHHGGRSFYNYIDSIMNTTLGERFNVFYFLGTIPIFLIFVLLITGLYMFIFYGLSVDNTYNSVKYITEEAPLGRVIRGIHRYSANFMVFFIILHMVRTFVEGKYQNHRRLAWITGVILLFFTLTEGITGYMMALNTTSHYILTKTSELFAATGIFGNSLPRTFAMPSLMGRWIMWIILIIHFAIPLIFAALIYIHTMRVSRAKIFLSRPMMIAITIILIVIAIVFPIELKNAADYNKIPTLEQVDWFYLFLSPFMREGNYVIILLSILSVFLLLIGVPWYKKRTIINHADLELSKCTGCGICEQDCPYNALQMQSRTDDNSKYKQEVKVDTKLCSGCGVCVGACDFAAMNLADTKLTDVRLKIQQIMGKDKSDNQWIGIFCKCLYDPINKDILKSELSNLHIITFPCSAMLGQHILDEIEKSGAKGLIIGSCPEGDCEYREGNVWLKNRILEKRSPRFNRLDKEFPVAQIRFNKVQYKEFIKMASDFMDNNSHKKGKVKRYISSIKQGKPVYNYSLTTIILSIFVWGLYFASIRPNILNSEETKKSLLKVNFFYKSSLKSIVESDKLKSKEYQLSVNKEFKRLSGSFRLEKLPKETKERLMRIAEDRAKEKITGRERCPLLLEIYMDNNNDKPIINTTFHPSGFRKDSLIYVDKNHLFSPGKHKIVIKAFELNDGKKVSGLKPFEIIENFDIGKSYFIDYSSKDSKFYLRTK